MPVFVTWFGGRECVEASDGFVRSLAWFLRCCLWTHWLIVPLCGQDPHPHPQHLRGRDPVLMEGLGFRLGEQIPPQLSNSPWALKTDRERI